MNQQSSVIAHRLKGNLTTELRFILLWFWWVKAFLVPILNIWDYNPGLILALQRGRLWKTEIVPLKLNLFQRFSHQPSHQVFWKKQNNNQETGRNISITLETNIQLCVTTSNWITGCLRSLGSRQRGHWQHEWLSSQANGSNPKTRTCVDHIVSITKIKSKDGPPIDQPAPSLLGPLLSREVLFHEGSCRLLMALSLKGVQHWVGMETKVKGDDRGFQETRKWPPNCGGRYSNGCSGHERFTSNHSSIQLRG